MRFEATKMGSSCTVYLSFSTCLISFSLFNLWTASHVYLLSFPMSSRTRLLLNVGVFPSSLSNSSFFIQSTQLIIFDNVG